MAALKHQWTMLIFDCHNFRTLFVVASKPCNRSTVLANPKSPTTTWQGNHQARSCVHLAASSLTTSILFKGNVIIASNLQSFWHQADLSVSFKPFTPLSWTANTSPCVVAIKCSGIGSTQVSNTGIKVGSVPWKSPSVDGYTPLQAAAAFSQRRCLKLNRNQGSSWARCHEKSASVDGYTPLQAAAAFSQRRCLKLNRNCRTATWPVPMATLQVQ